MTRLSYLFTAAAIAALSVGTASAATAITLGGADQLAKSPPMVQPVHWEYHHHHRFWVSDRHRHY